MPHRTTPPFPAPARSLRLPRAFVLLFVLAARVPAAPSGDCLRSAFAAEARGDPATALRFYARAAADRPNDAFVLQKISQQYSDLSDDVADPAAQRRLVTAALAYAKRSVALAPHSAVNVLSLAICYGKLALLADPRDKVAYARLIHDYAGRALALDPDYALAHHVLGRWDYEVASIGATKRFLARLFYGGLPPATFADAIREFRRACELEPRSPSHRVELGLALLADGQPAAARAAFLAALALPPRDQYDAESLRRAGTELARIR